ncbi:MAG: hypothetical protein KJ566_02880, partial [Nanoarchaeota archaeon]|nr:hypothetical protein [Nanoarchaeota archaeon]
METQTLMLGDIDIGKYINKLEITEKNLGNIHSKLKELKKGGLMISEREIYNDLISESISQKYPLIDLEFLSLSHEKVIPGKKKTLFGFALSKKDTIVKRPAFSAYKFYDSNKFSINFNGRFLEINNRENIFPEEILLPILKSIELYVGGANIECSEDCNENIFYIIENVNRYYDKLNIESEFKALIPDKVKQKVKESQQYFSKENIFIISETKFEEWYNPKTKSGTIFTQDPLIMGLNGKNAHIIDSFDTTPLEELIKNNS